MGNELCFDYNNFKGLLKLFEISIEDVYFEASYINEVSGLVIFMYWISPASALNYFQDKHLLRALGDELTDDYTVDVLVKGSWCHLTWDSERPFTDYLDGEVVKLIKTKKHVACRAWINGSGAGTPGDNWDYVKKPS